MCIDVSFRYPKFSLSGSCELSTKECLNSFVSTSFSLEVYRVRMKISVEKLLIITQTRVNFTCPRQFNVGTGSFSSVLFVHSSRFMLELLNNLNIVNMSPVIVHLYAQRTPVIALAFAFDTRNFIYSDQYIVRLGD